MDDILFNQADSEYNNGNFEKAFELFLKAAENGDDSAMDRIASMYDAGEGVDFDFDKAIYWYQKAVEAGSVTSLYNLGISYRSKGDVLKAKYWFEKALAAGDFDAALDLAKLHMVCEVEHEKVIFYLKKCLQGNNLFGCTRKEAIDILESFEKSQKGIRLDKWAFGPIGS